MDQWGFARMGHPLVGSANKGNCIKNFLRVSVKDGQGSPAWSCAECLPEMTLGSTMKSRADSPALSGSLLTRTSFWMRIFAILVVLGLGCIAVRAESANSYFKRGQTAEAREDYDAAYQNFQKAYSMSPKDVRYRAAY